ncbi:hypothetical protein REV77_003048 [Klebsiella aerogenes]|nr:hypothetical protein [Klebsiella aerogenes]
MKSTIKYILMILLSLQFSTSAQSASKSILSENAAMAYCRIQIDALKKSWDMSLTNKTIIDDAVKAQYQNGISFASMGTTELEYKKQLDIAVSAMRSNKNAFDNEYTIFLIKIAPQEASCVVQLSSTSERTVTGSK